jgi:two-component system, chemotaxis family, protein-glutamate methylesterase/glutaminase
MANRDIVVIGGSAGGFNGLVEILGSLPAPFPAAVFIVMHTSPSSGNMLARILSAKSDLRVSTATDNEPVTPGRVYVAPADHHMILDDSRVRVTRGPKENRSRPAIDPLFRSAALARGRRVIAVVLSGMLDDGTAGLWSVKDRGGIAIVQDPLEAEFPSMPENALQNVTVDYEVRVADIGPLLTRLVQEQLPEVSSTAPSHTLVVETGVANEENAMKSGTMQLGDLSPYACPECHGVLSQIREGGILRFRCHTGHAYSANSLLTSLSENTENVLWSAVRSLEETVILLCHMGEHLAEAGRDAEAEAVRREAKIADARIEQIRAIVMADAEEIEKERKEA